MKVSYQWLKEFVDLDWDAQQLADRLSLAGLEVAAVTPAMPELKDIRIAEIVSLEKHPDADKLNVCQVRIGKSEMAQIVCGAPNAIAGMKAPVILPGARLPDGTEIKRAKLRGVESAGMLCSARELGMGDDHGGLLALPGDAPVGELLKNYFGEHDEIIEIEITPNRGDCLGMIGVARDVAALKRSKARWPASIVAPVAHDERVAIDVRAPEACPVFLSRVIRNLDSKAETPWWMRERLRRAGIRPVSPIVDVTQYVMIELGQPMHAYDRREIDGDIVVRFASNGEQLALLDGSMMTLNPDVLVIADRQRPLGVAGIMGGEGSGVRADTSDIVLECAWFNPGVINGRPRRLGVHTDASYRFERGVDISIQQRAMERATELLLAIAGGQAGPISEVRSEQHLPPRPQIEMRRHRLGLLLGLEITAGEVEAILGSLMMSPQKTSAGWSVTVPSHRFDIEIEEDLIEEVGRIYGYDHIQPLQYPAMHDMVPVPEGSIPLSNLRPALVERGYQEVITYSFVAADLQQRLTGEVGIPLDNPITADMTHMRRSLWSGLLKVLAYNLNRQQSRIRIFETGLRFISQANEIKQENVIAGLVSGNRWPLQWGEAEQAADVADLLGDISALAAKSGNALSTRAEAHPALHPGQSARVYLGEQAIGWMGALHPEVAEMLDLAQSALLFELELDPLQQARLPAHRTIPKFPVNRRDLAVLVREELPVADLLNETHKAGERLLASATIFDIYQGKGIDSGLKSVALSLILQDSSRTLTDEDVEKAVAGIATHLQQRLGAKIRD